MERTPANDLPLLPAAEIRAAADDGDWARAADLVDGYDRAVRSALVEFPAGDARARWQAAVAEQQSLLLELQCLRDHAGEALRRLQHERRSAHAYLSQAASGDMPA